MKLVCLSFFLFCLQFLSAQAFHVDDTSALLIKNTSQSPAHWYVEVISDVSVDTTLRWKMRLENIPSQWDISFDDGTNNRTNLQEGDSGDFVLPYDVPYPHKLIIGAMLNNTAGHGVVYMDVFDPAVPEYVQTISYEFIISLAGLDELVSSGLFGLLNDEIVVLNQAETSFSVFNERGQKLVESTTHTSFDLNRLPQNQLVFIQVRQGNRQFIIHLMR